MKTYWLGLINSEFALAPQGDLPWSYHFVEAVVAGAIAVIWDEDTYINAEASFHYRKSDDMVWGAEVSR